jgi:hypothetical protein
MPNLPKLKVKKEAWKPEFDIVEFEQARSFPFNEELIITAEGRQVGSYEDLLSLALDEEHKNKKYLDVMFLPMICGG